MKNKKQHPNKESSMYKDPEAGRSLAVQGTERWPILPDIMRGILKAQSAVGEIGRCQSPPGLKYQLGFYSLCTWKPMRV